MATKTVESIPEVPPRPVPLTPSVLDGAVHRLKTLEERLVAQAANIREQLKDSAPDLPQQIVLTRTLVGQSEPGYELRQLVGHAEHLFVLLLGFTDALAQTRALREEGQALLLRTKEQLAGLRDDDLTQMEHREQMEKASGPLRYTIMNIGMLVDQVSPLLPIARACTGRVIQSAGIVARERLVKDMTARIDRARVMLANAKAPNAESERIDALVVRAEKMLDTSLPLPTLTWPRGTDPFAAPRLETT